MKKISVIIVFIIVALTTAKAYDNQYYLNEEEIEASFKNAEDITSQYLLMLNGGLFNQSGTLNAQSEDKQMVAGIIAIASFFVRGAFSFLFWIPYVGWIGVPLLWALAIVPWHRIYLKAGGQEFKIVALYCITLGWCINAHHVVDGIFLLLDESKSKYINNPKYVMWAN